MTDPDLALADRVEPAHYNDLSAVLDTAWDMLEAGAASARTAFHTPVLVTVAGDGGPDARTVVLRVADRAQRRLLCHTDARSAKFVQIQADARVAWLFYDPAAKIQLRVAAQAQIHMGDDVARARWEGSRLSSRRCYLAEHAPGALSDHPTSGLPGEMENSVPTAAQTEPGWSNFAVIESLATSIEWLYLAAKGHRRAAFAWDPACAEFAGHWLVP